MVSVSLRVNTILRLRDLQIKFYHDPKNKDISIKHISMDFIINELLNEKEAEKQ